MDNAGLIAAARQAGLVKDMRIVANNLANVSTTGFRRETAIFAEIVDQLAVDGGGAAQATARGRVTDFGQGALFATGGALDFAIEGEGFFLIEGAIGPRLTRAGSFVSNANGELTTSNGLRVLGDGGAPITLPPDARSVEVGADGTISADGQAVGRIALVTVENMASLRREADQLFEAPEGFVAADEVKLAQGRLEKSNVDPVREITRMIEIQRGYELGQSFIETEDERMRQAIRVMGSSS